MKNQRRICILYFENDPQPLADMLYDRLWGWKRQENVQCSFVNLAYSFSPELISQCQFDGFVLDTTLLRRRWNEELLSDTLQRLNRIDFDKANVIAIPHDECSSSNALNEILIAANCTHVFSCATIKDQDIIYPSPRAFGITEILTCYISPRLRKVAARPVKPLERREILISYRANLAHRPLGWAGWIKERIGRKFAEYCDKSGIVHNIKIGSEYRLLGNDWIKLLAKSRAVLGCESGGTVLDSDGLLSEKLYNFDQKELAKFYDNPQAEFSGQYQAIQLLTLSARHLEAACTATPQALISGSYNNILKPNDHYVPVNRDLSNIEETVLRLQNHEDMQSMAGRLKDYVLACDDLDEGAFYQQPPRPPPASNIQIKFMLFLLSWKHIGGRITLFFKRNYQLIKFRLSSS